MGFSKWFHNLFPCKRKVKKISEPEPQPFVTAILEPIKTPILYVILPYFNYCGFRRRRDLFIEFVARIRQNPAIRIIVAEVSEYGSTVATLPSLAGVHKHYRFFTKHCIWLKENLLNLAIRKLPQSWEYAAWIDTDLTFMNKSWAMDTVEALQVHDIVQMFDRCDYLDPDGNVHKTDRSFGYMYRESGQPHRHDHRYGFWHPGMAWACTRRAFNQMHGLIDWAILGSADHHMSLAWIGKVDTSHPGGIHSNYVRMLTEFQKRCHCLTLGYVKGTILHHWHGSLKDRRYVERWNILVKNQYDPLQDIGRNAVGLIQLTPNGRRFAEPIREYFAGRREDNLINDDPKK
jgi:hypothetical protein